MTLTQIDQIDTDIRSYLSQLGEIFKVFDRQDSNCLSYGVAIDGRRWFVKESSDPAAVEGLQRADLYPSVAAFVRAWRGQWGMGEENGAKWRDFWG